MDVFGKTLAIFFLTSMMLLSGAAPPAVAGNAAPATVAKTDKCPVCGMFVAKYPDFLGQIIFSDDSHAFFDGAKDMFK
jgi:nitrous oxide reductase accessory protein NosL